MQPLPIHPLLPDVVASLRARPRLVLEAPPGAGKTTRVPRALFDAGFAERGEIVVLEPRRLAARLAARRVAEELGERLGDTVGYTVRFEDVSGPKTRIRFVTEGVLTRRLLSGRALHGIGAVVLDEFHERHLQGDVALALLDRLAGDAAVVVMSATLATAPIAAYLDAPTLRAEGRRFEVAIEHLPSLDDRPLPSQVASALRRLLSEGLRGDVLVFLPGAQEIRKTREACEALAAEANLLLLPLHGDLSPAEQDRAVRPAEQRKVILATNVAESSVTIDGVTAVIDSGLARVASHSPWSGLPTLKVERVSRASATQRAGRAGRTQPGRCLRLYTKHDHDTRAEHDLAEVLRIDLAQTLLELAAAGIGDLRWLDAPPDDARRAAEELLVRLGALDASGKPTATGRAMALFAVHPRQARLLVESERRGVIDDACVVAALLAERDIRRAARARFDDGGRAHDVATERSDLVAMLDAFREAEASGFSAHAMRAAGLDAGATQAAARARDKLRRGFAKRGRDEMRNTRDAEDALLKCVLAGYPDRVARRLRPGARSLALAGGGTAELSETSAVRDATFVVAVDAGERQGFSRGARGVVVRTASAIEPEWLIDLFPEAIEETRDVRFDAGAQRVEVLERMLYDGLVIDESPRARPTGEDVSRVLAEAAAAAGARAFAAEEALDRWLARVRIAAQVKPEIKAPSDAEVTASLVALCEGRRSFAELREADLLETLKTNAGRASDVERLAPEKIALLAGRTARISYDPGKPPWIETYLQDFFGMARSPAIGDGRLPLVLHLLAPNKRAVQVTSDLAGFWERHYPAIRKELMRKYPRHSWPEDPTVPAPRFTREGRR